MTMLARRYRASTAVEVAGGVPTVVAGLEESTGEHPELLQATTQ